MPAAKVVCWAQYMTAAIVNYCSGCCSSSQTRGRHSTGCGRFECDFEMRWMTKILKGFAGWEAAGAKVSCVAFVAAINGSEEEAEVASRSFGDSLWEA